MELAVLNNLRKKFLDALNAMGIHLIKKKRERRAPKNKSLFTPRSKPMDQDEKSRPQDDVLGHKGSGYKGKGSINTDAAIFNHPRKDEHRGRQH